MSPRQKRRTEIGETWEAIRQRGIIAETSAQSAEGLSDKERWALDDAEDAAERERRGLLGLPGGFVGK
jgi:hypothetical protein